MPQISKLKAQKNRQRVNIYLDGKYATSLDLITVTKLGLKVGMTVSQTKLHKLISAHQFQKLFRLVTNFLSYRPRSEKEIKTYLQRKWRAETTKEQHRKNIEKIIVKLKQQKLVNDQEFANWWINQRQEFRPRGKRLLKLELRQKGIDIQLIEKALTKYDEFAAALRVTKKQMKSLKKLESLKAKQKLKNLLFRRGFNWEVIQRVVDELTKQE